MKIWIDSITPELTQMLHLDRYEYLVKHWVVNGAYLEDPEACTCGKLPFKAIIPSDGTLSISKKTAEILCKDEIIKLLQNVPKN